MGLPSFVMRGFFDVQIQRYHIELTLIQIKKPKWPFNDFPGPVDEMIELKQDLR